METDTAVGAGVRVTVSRDELSSRLALVSRATSTRGTVQVLGGILLRASDGLVELEATDMELSLRTTVQAEVEGEGALVIPARLLGDIVKLLPAETVTVIAGGSRPYCLRSAAFSSTTARIWADCSRESRPTT